MDAISIIIYHLMLQANQLKDKKQNETRKINQLHIQRLGWNPNDSYIFEWNARILKSETEKHHKNLQFTIFWLVSFIFTFFSSLFKECDRVEKRGEKKASNRYDIEFCVLLLTTS